MDSSIIEKLNKKYKGKTSEKKLKGESTRRYLFRKRIKEKLEDLYDNIKPATSDELSKQFSDHFFLNLEYDKSIETQLEIISMELFI